MITISDALRIASRSVSIYRTGRASWTVYRPYYWDQPDGPTTASDHPDYHAARRDAGVLCAAIAMTLCGVPDRGVFEAMYRVQDGEPWRAVARSHIADHRRSTHA